MKQHPILMKGPLVLQTKADQKTQTRRLTGLDEINKDPERWEFVRFFNGYAKFCEKHNHTNEVYVKCPYGQPEDILWVRETWRKYCFVDSMGYTHFDQEIIEYAADNPGMIYLVDGDGARMYNKDGTEKFVPWRPSIHMPKSACRLYLQITDIRVERLNAITWDDAVAEGCPGYRAEQDEPTEQFKRLWQSINGPDSWDSNPFVWVINFKRIEKPS